MFGLYTAMRNIKRQKIKSLLNAGICSLIVLLLSLYFGTIESNQRQLQVLPDAIPVYGRIVNLNGSREVGLNISEKVIERLEASQYIKDMVYTAYVKAGIGEFAPEEWKEHLDYTILGTNSIQGATGLEERDITLQEGMNLDFLTSSSSGCIISKDVMEKNQWKIGDKIPLNLYYYSRPSLYEVYLDPLELMTVEIVGYMDVAALQALNDPPEIIMPARILWDSHQKRGLPFFADSAFFNLKNTLQLNAFKDTMDTKGFKLLSVAPAAQDDLSGNTLILRDSLFISAATRLRQGIDILSGFFSAVFLTVIVVGYIAAYLLIQNRKRELSLMRSIGFSRMRCFGIFFTEQILFALGSGIFGGIIAMLFMSDIRAILRTVSVFSLCYLLGTITALWQISGKSVMKALAVAD